MDTRLTALRKENDLSTDVSKQIEELAQMTVRVPLGANRQLRAGQRGPYQRREERSHRSILRSEYRLYSKRRHVHNDTGQRSGRATDLERSAAIHRAYGNAERRHRSRVGT